MLRMLYVLMLISTAATAQPSTLIVISDTQQPIWIETLRLKEDDNENAARAMYGEILRDSAAAAVLHLGDITSAGMFSSLWGPFDEFHRALRVPLYPALGNHDYFFLHDAAMNEFRHRFPERVHSWYSFTIGRVGIVVLNSNFSRLSDDEREQQQRWYHGRMTSFDEDTTIAAVVVACHHSPYTNSSIVEPSRGVQNRFASLFSMFPKSLLFLSGHAHTYEHFRVRGKDFVVTGGGGGLLQPLLPRNERRFTDLYDAPGDRRFFHYAACVIGDSSMQVQVMRLRPDHSGMEKADSLFLPYPRREQP